MAAILTCVWVVSSAHAQEADPSSKMAEADSYAEITARAIAQFDAENFTEARKLFEQAHQLRPSARTYRALGLTSLAQDEYELARDEIAAALADSRQPLTPAQRRELLQWVEWMRTELGEVRIVLSPAQARVTVDGKSIAQEGLYGRLFMRGEHTLRAEADGFLPLTKTFNVGREPVQELLVHLEPIGLRAPATVAQARPSSPSVEPQAIATAAPSSYPVWPWIVGGAGVAATVAGSVLLALALQDKAAVENAPDGVPLATIEAAHERVPWESALGVGIGVAGLACIAAAVFGIAQESGTMAKSTRVAEGVQARLSPTGLSVFGHF